MAAWQNGHEPYRAHLLTAPRCTAVDALPRVRPCQPDDGVPCCDLGRHSFRRERHATRTLTSPPLLDTLPRNDVSTDRTPNTCRRCRRRALSVSHAVLWRTEVCLPVGCFVFAPLRLSTELVMCFHSSTACDMSYAFRPDELCSAQYLWSDDGIWCFLCMRM